VYRRILAGTGFGLEDARSSITLVHQLRNARPVKPAPELAHPFLARR
jgi:UDP-N-acetyl-2-amino-2-deoxyglucuronate dehydrogenase